MHTYTHKTKHTLSNYGNHQLAHRCSLRVQVAERAGVALPMGCYSGNCGVCEVELNKVSPDGSTSSLVVRSCITVLPRGYPRLEVDELVDSVWGLDGFDT